MTKEELLKPRKIVVLDFPQIWFTDDVSENPIRKGDILMQYIEGVDVWRKVENNEWTAHTVHTPDLFPEIFRDLEWWEEREAKDMPKKVMSLADSNGDTFNIEEWDMELLVGWVNKEERSCCSLLTFKPEYGYVPAD